MAVEIEVERVKDEERLLGGDIVWWLVLLLFSVPVLIFGLTKTPETGGFLLMSVGGIMAGVSFAQVGLRLPYFTNRLLGSLALLMVGAGIIGAILLVYSWSLPVPTAPLDVMYKPPVSGG